MTASPSELARLKADYDRLGYCLADGLYSSRDLQAIEDFFEDFKTSGGRIFDGDQVFSEVDKTQSQVRARQPHHYSRRVVGWLIHPPVARVLETLLGKPALGAQTMYYYKPPGARGQAMHQDNFYLVAKPATCIAAWTPIDDADVENGCLHIAPGSQRLDIICPEDGGKPWMDYGDGHITRFPRACRPVPVPVRRGQTLFFGGNVIHGSGPNRTRDRFRRTFIGHYVDQATEEVGRHYHPVIAMDGQTVSRVAVAAGGGPCGGGWAGAEH